MEFDGTPQRAALDRIVATDQNDSIKHKLEVGTHLSKFATHLLIHFQLLMMDLDKVKEENELTEFDILHYANRKQGRNRHNTLKEIQSGITQRRIDQFENM